MAEFSSGFSGDVFLFRITKDDGSVLTARLPTGSHSGADQDAVIAALRQDYATLRQWAIDAQNAYNAWPGQTTAQQLATTREVIRRLGIFFNHFGDLLVALNADS